jgi:hypothetical protein
VLLPFLVVLPPDSTSSSRLSFLVGVLLSPLGDTGPNLFQLDISDALECLSWRPAWYTLWTNGRAGTSTLLGWTCGPACSCLDCDPCWQDLGRAFAMAHHIPFRDRFVTPFRAGKALAESSLSVLTRLPPSLLDDPFPSHAPPCWQSSG